MKVLVILLLLGDPIVVPFTKGLTCSQQGDAYVEKIATYSDQTDTLDQGWYTSKGNLVYGYYCD